MSQQTPVQNVVLVHGGFVDGSGWQPVHELLTAGGYKVIVVQNATIDLDSDVRTTTQAIESMDGPVTLVGHSYGGMVITEAGTHEQVRSLAYIAAFAPDKGETVSSLIADAPAGAPVPPILPPQNGFLFLQRDKFAEAFAADLDPAQSNFMAASQVPWGVGALAAPVSEPAWRSKPSWYLVSTEDRMIPPAAQHAMAQRADARVSEVVASHAVYLSQPQAVVDVIERAALGA